MNILLNLIPCGRNGEPAGIALATLRLESAPSDCMSGTPMFADGGMPAFTLFRGVA